MSLYIGGAQSIFSEFKDDSMWRNFDELSEKLTKLSEKFNVYIDRHSINEQSPDSFVIMNKKPSFECFYSGAAFDYDMHVETSDTFELRAKQFIKALEEEPEFQIFHHLDWQGPKVYYFVIS